MSVQEDNLDDVISSLIDDEGGEDHDESKSDLLPQNPESSEPVILTERAAKQISKIKSDENLDDDLYLRIAVEGGGCSGLSYKLGFDFKNSDDELIESEGIQIVIDSKHVMYLGGIRIDYPDGLDARGFTFDNPNASESCGCGTSFAV
ncbi:MAG TPA: iron-sulfur cluster assembly accessory protein [Balneolaceae bacterium]|nr:iron-sulfur cluster assembly accessory protein [Balneolaceae bacterium]